VRAWSRRVETGGRGENESHIPEVGERTSLTYRFFLPIGFSDV
jgi:hypothetical protein